MNRIFGTKKPAAPQVNISEVHGRVDARVSDLDLKVCQSQSVIGVVAVTKFCDQIAKLDEELKKYKEQVVKEYEQEPTYGVHSYMRIDGENERASRKFNQAASSSNAETKENVRTTA